MDWDDGEGDGFMDEFGGEYFNYHHNNEDNVNRNEHDMLPKVTDTSAAQAREGKDVQGIPWDRLNITRQSIRVTRLEQYRNYENIPLSGESVDKISQDGTSTTFSKASL
nr:uncharacterized WD repeat-containing protein C2A9.03-like [Ipomoea batatas]